jgi:glutamate/tyrosine decarboxylase-like PLP-dependent enzyme
VPTDLQRRFFAELEAKTGMERARSAAFAYADSVFDRRVAPDDATVARLSVFDGPFPERGTPDVEVVGLLDEVGSPATVASLGGRYFGMVIGSSLPAALAARWLGDMWDQNTALYRLSPVGGELERICEAWLKAIFALPAETVAGFVSGTSTAIQCGLAAARWRAFRNHQWDVNTRGFRDAPPLRVVASRHTHGTVVKGVALMGFGTDHIEWVDCDEQGRILPERVPDLDPSSILILQAGNVNSGSFDDFARIVPKAKAEGAWVHVDGAFGLWAAACPRLAHLTAGANGADSWSIDGHKTLNTPYDSGIVLSRDAEALAGALQASGSYILYGEKRDGMLYTPEMSRRARGVELWAALKSLGAEGLDQLVGALHDRAVQFADELRAEGFAVPNDVVFNQVLVACADDAETDATIDHIQRDGECWVGGAKWDGRAIIRISVCSWATTEADVTRSVRAFVSARAKARDG